MVWYISCLLISFLLWNYPIQERGGQLYVFPDTKKSALMDRILSIQIDNGILGDRAYYYQVYTDTTRMDETSYTVQNRYAVEYDEDNTTFFYVFLKAIKGYASFCTMNQGKETHVVLKGYYMEDCRPDTVDNVVLLSENYRDFSQKIPFSERKDVITSFENEFLNKTGGFQRDDMQGFFSYTDSRFWETPSPHIFAFFIFVFCVIFFLFVK